MLRLATVRLELRSFLPDDAERLWELDRDPDVMRYVGPSGLDSVDAYRQRIQDVYAPYQPVEIRPFSVAAVLSGGRCVVSRDEGK